MSPSLYIGFVATCLVLMVMPGPNVALIVANSLAHGTRYGLMTVGGTSTAIAVHLVATFFATASLFTLLASSFAYLRWLGVAYLIFLGVRTWRQQHDDLALVPQPRSMRLVFLRGVAISLTNPKVLFFYGAFFPQFIEADKPIAPQLLALTSTFLVLAIVFDCGWAILAGRLRNVVAGYTRLRHRLTGGVLIAAGLGLATARKAA
jgi:threonine/homoserine/homoserine lactone efflux protein